jgi:hypothetical protein
VDAASNRCWVWPLKSGNAPLQQLSSSIAQKKRWPLRQHRQHRLRPCRASPLKRFGSTIADPTDGTDGTDVIFRRSAYPDYSGSGSAFTTERNVNAKRPKKCLRPTQVRSQGARIFYPPGAVACLRAAFNANPQKIRGAARPRATLAHEFPNARNDRVGIDDTLNRVLAVGRVGASESASGPECVSQAVAQSAKSAIRGS